MSKGRRSKANRKSIVMAALDVADRVGMNALTIRRVAVAAGVAPMSLYTYFRSKEALLDVMYEEVAAKIYPEADSGDWQSLLRDFCHNLREVLLEHPQWLSLMARPAAVLTMPNREALLAAMTHAGIPAEEALATLSSAGLMALGWTTVELSFRDRDGASPFVKRLENLRARKDDAKFASDNPVTLVGLRRGTALDLRDSFNSSIDAFIAGLDVRFAGLQAPH